MSLLAHLADRLKKRPERVAFIIVNDECNDEISVATLLTAASNLAAVLEKRTIRGQCILVAVSSVFDQLVCILACLFAKTECVLFDYYPTIPQALLMQTCYDCNISLIIAEQKNGNIEGIRWINIRKAEKTSIAHTKIGSLGADSERSICFYDIKARTCSRWRLDQLTQAVSALARGLNLKNSNSASLGWQVLHTKTGLLYNVLLPLCVDSPIFLVQPAALDVTPGIWLSMSSTYRIGFCCTTMAILTRSLSFLDTQAARILDLSVLHIMLLDEQPIETELLTYFIEGLSATQFSPKQLLLSYTRPNTPIPLAVKPSSMPPIKYYLDRQALMADRIKPIAIGSDNTVVVHSRGRLLQPTCTTIVDQTQHQPLGAMQIGLVQWQSQEHTQLTHDLGFINSHGELFICGNVEDRLSIGPYQFNKTYFESALIKQYPSLSLHRFFYFAELHATHLALIVAFATHLDAESINIIFEHIAVVMPSFFNIANVKCVAFKTQSIDDEPNEHTVDVVREKWINKTLDCVATWSLPTDDKRHYDALINIENIDKEQAALVFTQWLIAWLARTYVHPLPAKVLQKHFAGLGLDDTHAVTLANDIYRVFGQWFTPAYLWEFPNFKTLSHFLFNSDYNDDQQLPPIHAIHATHSGQLSDQEAVLYHATRDADRSVYNGYYYLSLVGPLCHNAFRQAWQQVADRHAILRADYQWRNSTCFRAIHAQCTISLEMIDIRNKEPEAQDEHLHQLLTAFERESFAIDSSPLWHVMLIVFSSKEYGLALKCHRIIADHWSVLRIMDETAQLTSWLQAHQKPCLPPLAYHYDDYASWQQVCRVHPMKQQQTSYWQQHLHRCKPLRLSAESPTIDDAAAHTAHISLTQKQTSALIALIKKREIALNAVIITICQILLYQLSQERQITLKYATANRQHAYSDGIVGQFERAFIMTEHVYPHMPLSTLMTINHNALTQHYRHADIPYSAIHAALPTSLQPSLPNCTVVVEQYPASLQFGSAKAKPIFNCYPRNKLADHQHLVVQHFYTEETLSIVLQLRKSLFDQGQTQRIRQHYVQIISQLEHQFDPTIEAIVKP